MSRKRLKPNEGFTLLEAVACLALIGAVAVPIGSALAVISQGPRERQTHTSVATGLESALERICAMDFDDVPMSEDGKPVNLGITACVNGQSRPVKVYVEPWGFLRNIEWDKKAVSLDDDALTPDDPWELKVDGTAGLVYDPDVKLVKVELSGMNMSTILVRNQTHWQPGGVSVGDGVTPAPDTSDPKKAKRPKKYKGSMKCSKSKSRLPWLNWIKSKKRSH